MKKILVLCLITVASSCFAQRVVLDRTFGVSGVVTCKVNSYVDKIVSITDGKFLCLGAYTDNLGGLRLALFKFNVNGWLDSTFSEDGILQDTVNNISISPYNFMNTQPDGRIFTAGSNSNITYISCYDSIGNPILTFGKSGVLKLDTLENVSSRPMLFGFSSCPDNKIIVCWRGFYTKSGSSWGCILAKFDSTGCIDRSFGTEGFLFFNYSSMRFNVDAITVLKDGSIICTGSNLDLNDKYNEKTAIIKLKSDGTFNNDFGIGGQMIIDVDPSDHYDPFYHNYLETARNAIELDDHRMIVSTVTNKSTGDYLIRLMPDGSLDKTFGNNGITKLFTHIEDLAVHDGGIFTTTRNQINYFSLNGKADSTINLGNTNFGSITCISIQDNDKIILGSSPLSANSTYYAIAKFNIGPPVSIPKIKAQTNSVSIFPTFFSNTLTIRTDHSLIQKITMYDLNGKCVLSKSVADTTCTLNVALVPGMYLCKIMTTKGIEYHKLVSTKALN